MNFLQLCKDHGIETAGPDHHHVSEGWIGIHCPFCAGSRNFHMGFNIRSNTVNCWRCGPHRLDETLERLTGETFTSLWARYAGSSSRAAPRMLKKKPKPAPEELQRELELPRGFTIELTRPHARYLERRGFDPDHLVREWHIASTRPTSIIKVSETERQRFGNRIFIPMYWYHKLVTFQARAIKLPASRAHMKYKACPQEIETRSIRQIIYRHPDTISPSGICVEGATDVWRMGRHAFAVLGIEFSKAQATLIARLYRRVMLLFDPEPQAQTRALRMQRQLKMLGVDAFIHTLPAGTDPGDLTKGMAAMIVKHLLQPEARK